MLERHNTLTVRPWLPRRIVPGTTLPAPSAAGAAARLTCGLLGTAAGLTALFAITGAVIAALTTMRRDIT